MPVVQMRMAAAAGLAVTEESLRLRVYRGQEILLRLQVDLAGQPDLELDWGSPAMRGVPA